MCGFRFIAWAFSAFRFLEKLGVVAALRVRGLGRTLGVHMGAPGQVSVCWHSSDGAVILKLKLPTIPFPNPRPNPTTLEQSRVVPKTPYPDPQPLHILARIASACPRARQGEEAAPASATGTSEVPPGELNYEA